MGDISGAVLVLYSYLSLCWLQSRMYPHGIQHHDPLPRGIIHQIKPKTSYFHQVKGSHNPNTYGKNKGCIQGGTETPFLYWQSKNNYFYVMCLFYVKWPMNHFLLMTFRSLGPLKREFVKKTIADFRLGAISPRQGRQAGCLGFIAPKRFPGNK